MNNDHGILTGTDSEAIRILLKRRASEPVLQEWTELYESIWHMTYANASDMPELEGMDLAEQIVLMNQQEDLLPRTLSAISKVTGLDLGGFPDAVLFPELKRYTSLRKLDLWENGLTEIPAGIFELTSLEELRIIDPVTQLPDEFVRLKHLKKLCIEGKISRIPEAFRHMTELQSLELELNDLESIPDFLAELPQLKNLVLSYNTTLQIPQDLADKFRTKDINLQY